MSPAHPVIQFLSSGGGVAVGAVAFNLFMRRARHRG
jgi:hypothetical protein